jgi:hypothetical protein
VATTVLLLGPGVAPAAADEKDLFGWVEQVLVGAHEIELKAKLDTGAETSSLDATRIRRLRRTSSGERFVEFDLADPNTGDAITLKERLVREVRIKEHDGSFQTRPVVVLPVCLGRHLRDIEVSLIDRSEFIYPLLLGRSALAGIALVDPNLTLTTKPDCRAEEGTK